MREMIREFILICLILTVIVSGCLSPDDEDNTTTDTIDNATSNVSDLHYMLEKFTNPIDNSSYVMPNTSAYLTKHTRIADDRKSIIFVFDEDIGDNWELKIEPKNVLKMTTDEHITPEGAAEGTPGVRMLIFESVEPGKVIMNLNYIVADTGNSINNIYYVIEVLDSGEIRIISILYERL